MTNYVCICKKSNCGFKIIYIHACEFLYMIFCAAMAYKNPQKNTRQVFSFHVFYIFFVYRLIRDDTQYIKIIDN